MTLEEQIKAAVAEAVNERVEAVLLRVLPEAIRRATEPEYLGRQEAADFAGMGLRSLDYRLKNRTIPHVKRGNRVLVPTKALRQYLNEGAINTRAVTRQECRP